MIQSVTFPGTLPALNEIINASTGHWGSYRGERKKAVAWCRLFIRRARLVTPSALPVFTHYLFTPQDYRKDPSNLTAGAAKVVEDSLQDEGVLPNDGHKQIAGIWHSFAPKNPKNPSITLTLIPHTEVELWLTENAHILKSRCGV